MGIEEPLFCQCIRVMHNFEEDDGLLLGFVHKPWSGQVVEFTRHLSLGNFVQQA